MSYTYVLNLTNPSLKTVLTIFKLEIFKILRYLVVKEIGGFISGPNLVKESFAIAFSTKHLEIGVSERKLAMG